MKKMLFLLLILVPVLSSCDPNNNKTRFVTRHTTKRGLVYFYPYITGDLFRILSHHIVDDTHIPFYPEKVGEKDVIFVKTKYLRRFFKYMHPKIKNPYILITGNGDEEAPGPYLSFLEDERILVWFGINATVDHPKLIPIPIGAGRPELTQIASEPIPKERLLYLNFQEENHPERVLAKSYFQKTSFCTLDERRPFPEYLREVKRSKFQVSPRGNGIDCYRVWESILVGTIPVLKSTPLDPLYRDLPVLIVKDWEEVTEPFLEAQYQKLSVKPYNPEKLYADYWLKLIDSYTPGRYYSLERLKLYL